MILMRLRGVRPDHVLDAGVEVLGVLADDDEVDVLVARLETRASSAPGRRFAYRSSVWRSVTLTLRKPSPTGVVIGPLSATLLRRIDSRTCSGSGVPYSAIDGLAGVHLTSHSNATPDASSTRRVASASSGPMPSPGMRVTRWAMPRC